MIRILATVCLAMLIETAFAQQHKYNYPQLPAKGKSPVSFLPPSWELHTVADGFLNKDGFRDYAFVIEKKEAVTVKDEYGDERKMKPRILAVVFKNEEGFYRLVTQSNTFIPVNSIPSNMEEPFTAMDIDEKGVLLFKYIRFANTGSWDSYYYTYRFRYQQDDFVLIGADCTYINRRTGEQDDYSYNFLTRKRSHTKGMMDNPDEPSPQKPVTDRKNIPVQKPRTLRTWGQPFTWQVDKEDKILF